jgi:hypothetical protein
LFRAMARTEDTRRGAKKSIWESSAGWN